jgi:hypothetical protein
MNGPASPTIFMVNANFTGTSPVAGFNTPQFAQTAYDTPIINGNQAGSNYIAFIQGIITVGSTSGTVAVRISQTTNAPSSPTTFRKGSFLEYTVI